jgi:hypothetical protein
MTAGGRRWPRVALAALAVATAGLAGLPRAAARAAGASPTPVRDRYGAPGPYGVVHEALPDSFGGVPYELFSPRELGPDGARHPLISWGNGSFAHPIEYDGLLRHLASWGFVVIASTFDQVGTGQEQLAAVHRAGRLDEDPTSRVFHHVDLTRVGAAGHSQGAGGTVRAATAPGSPITAILTADLPSALFTFTPQTKGFDTAALRVPVLFLSGQDDQLISGTTTNQGYLAAVPGPGGMAMLQGADHNAVQHSGGGYLGYVAAWFRYQLADDPVAAGAFTGAHPELLTAPGWQEQALKGLRPPASPAPSSATAGAGGNAAPAPTAPPVPPTAVAPEARLPATGGSSRPVLAGVLLAAALAARRVRAAT